MRGCGEDIVSGACGEVAVVGWCEVLCLLCWGRVGDDEGKLLFQGTEGDRVGVVERIHV